jgi:PAS domain S-box-containing protein
MYGLKHRFLLQELSSDCKPKRVLRVCLVIGCPEDSMTEDHPSPSRISSRAHEFDGNPFWPASHAKQRAHLYQTGILRIVNIQLKMGLKWLSLWQLLPMKLLTNKSIFSGFLIHLLVVLILAWTAVKRMENMKWLHELAVHQAEVSARLQKALYLVNRIQNDAKAYALVRNAAYFLRIDQSVFEAGKNLEELAYLLREDRVQVARLQALEKAIDRETRGHRELMEHARYRNAESARAVFVAQENMRLNSVIEALIAALQTTEENRLPEKKERLHAQEKTLKTVFWACMWLSVTLLVTVLFMLRRYLRLKNETEDLLAQSTQLLRALVDNSSNLIYVKALNGEYLLTNKPFDGAFAGAGGTVNGKTDEEFFSKEIAGQRRASDLEVVKTDKEQKFNEVLPQNGSLHTYLTTKFPIRTPQGRIYAVGGISLDVSEQTRQSTAVKEQYDQAEKIFTAAPDAIIVIDEESKILRWNPKAEEIFRWQEAEVIGKPLYDTIMPPRLRELHMRGLQNFMHSGKGPILNKTVEMKALTKAGAEIDIELTVSYSHNHRFIFIAFLRDITERKKMEQEVLQTRNFLNSVLDNMPDMLIIKDTKDLRIVRANRAAEKALGYDRGELAGRTDRDIFSREKADRFEASDREVLARQTLVEIPEEAVDTRNGMRWLHTKKTLVPGDKEQPLYLLSISEDITPRKALVDERNKAYQQLRESEQKISLILENIGDAVIATDENMLITFMNPVAEKLTGWEEADAKGKHIDRIFKIVNETTRQRVENPIVQALTGKKIVSLEKDTVLIKKDQTEIAIDDTGSPILTEKGEVSGAVLIFRDVTEEIKSARELRDSARRFTQIFNFTPVAISISEQETGTFLYVNDAFCKTVGYAREELIGKTSVQMNILGADQRKALYQQIKEAGGQARSVETTIRAAKGNLLSVLYSVDAIEMDNKPCAVVALIDITERKNSEMRIAMVLENLDEGVILANADQKILLSNRLADEILGGRDVYYSSDWTDRYDIFYPDGKTLFPAQNLPIEKGLRGETVHDLEIVLQDPETRTRKLLRVSGQPIFAQEGRLLGAVATLKDITKIRETEKVLEETEIKYRKLIGFGRDKDTGK